MFDEHKHLMGLITNVLPGKNMRIVCHYATWYMINVLPGNSI